jgi:hypothetical protein
MPNSPSAPTVETLPSIIEDFKRTIGYCGNLVIAGPHHRYKFVDDLTKEVQFPHADEPGCYVFFTEMEGQRGKVLYVGKGSRYMGQRIWAPFGRQKRNGEIEPFPDAKPWVKEHRPGVYAVAVPKEHWWLAMALEGYLIETFTPPENKRLR